MDEQTLVVVELLSRLKTKVNKFKKAFENKTCENAKELLTNFQKDFNDYYQRNVTKDMYKE